VKFLVGSVSSEVKKNIAEFIFMTLVSAVALPLGMLIIRSILIRHTGWQAAGEWQAVWKISEAYLSIITMGLAVYYLPKLSTLHDRDAMLSEIRSVAAVVLPVIVIMAVMVYLLRDFAISLLYTEQFRSARDLFKIQLIGDVIKVMSWLYAYPLIAKKATRLFVSTEIIFTATLIFLSYYFILSFGVQGANIAYAVNYLLYFAFVYFAVNKYIKM
jgi:PST family polysaccharide transporter